ncbi:MAG TPA: formate dehydrogenase accessory sulfurtransferase FdhD [Anaerolineales bacterium]|nr:formate dehydrogenase accessory sulfurtransferase FdhD [Anaerolineales bacterium]
MIQDQKHIQYTYFRQGGWERVDAAIIVEAPVTLTVNGQDWLTFMCTPNQQDALAVGFLFNEGIINTMREVASLHVCAHGDNVDVWLTHTAEKPEQWRRTSGCTGGVTANDHETIRPIIQNGVTLTAGQVGQLVDQLFGAQQLYRQVRGVHTSVLSDGRRARVMAEDIGRHNSVDKIAGRCLLDGLRLRRKILLTTGRISSEMLQKAARLGAPIVISRTSPSSLSIELAQKWGITLIGYARRDRFNVYAHPARIVSSYQTDNTEVHNAAEYDYAPGD